METCFLNGVRVIADNGISSEVEKCLEELLGESAWLGVELSAAVGEKDNEIGFGSGFGYVLLDLVELRSLNGI